MATYDWGNIPLVALRNVLQYLELKEVLRATSTCNHWRQAILMIDGYRETLLLKTSQLHKSLFLAQIYRRYVKRLHIEMDYQEDQLNKFFEQIVPMFCGIGNIKEIVFVVPGTNLEKDVNLMMPLKKTIVERLINAHSPTLTSLCYWGCSIVSKKMKITEHPLLKKYFTSTQVIKYTLSNGNLKNFECLKSLILDFDILDQNILKSLANLPKLTHLSLNISRRSMCENEVEINWDVLQKFPNTVDLAVNIITVHKSMFPYIIERVLVPSMPVNRVRVMFCEVFEPFLILHMTTFKYSLREFVWVDAARNRHRNINLFSNQEADGDIHPLIWLCWQCTLLEKLVVHGYWVWQYDLLGMARLRTESMKVLEVSATYALAPHNPKQDTDVVHPVIYRESHQAVGEYFIKQINEFLSFKWEPILNWNNMDRALLPNAPEDVKYKYILKQILPQD